MRTIGFVGSKRGMTTQQRARLESVLRQLVRQGPLIAHVGDHVGSDCDFSGLCRVVGGGKISLVRHPARDCRSRFREACCVTRPPAGFAMRARAIVSESDVAIACPRQQVQADRGGTWGVIQYARAKGKRVVIVAPDGTCCQF